MQYVCMLAREADASAVFALYQSLIGTPGCTWNERYPTEEWVHDDIRHDALYVLKDEQGVLVAAASAGGERELDDLAWEPKNPCELARVGVALTHRHQGVGSYLLQQVMRAVKQRGYDGIVMLVSPDNTAAIALYAKHGFTRCGEINRYGLAFDRYQITLRA
ncbi:MAG: GNAT family N-acetyltransferase [Firmicutes bacterium]|nr:GNAT family N-acetyltransferase [Bacillota bacterium]